MKQLLVIDGKTISAKRIAKHLADQQALGEIDAKKFLIEVNRELYDAMKGMELLTKNMTVYDALKMKLGREPTHQEQIADVKRILSEKL
jgi:hypothetical protein